MKTKEKQFSIPYKFAYRGTGLPAATPQRSAQNCRACQCTYSTAVTF
jgi:hypothetical protein